MKRNKKIAVTGGIGSGKSVFCNILKEMGLSVFSCDDISRRLWQNEDYLQGLASLFPKYTRNGVIDKNLLSSEVFTDEKKLSRLNAYAHPRIIETLLAEMQGENVCFAEVPLLFEGGFEHLFDGVIALRRNKDARFSSVQQRDGIGTREIAERMRTQFDPERLHEKRCIIVENNGSLADLRQKADAAVKTILQS